MEWIRDESLSLRCRRNMRANLDTLNEAMPRWSPRLNDRDRDAIVQVMSDLELLLNLLNGKSEEQKIKPPTFVKSKPKPEVTKVA